MRIDECMSIYNRPTLLQKKLKATEMYSGLKCGSVMIVEREQQSQKLKFHKVKSGAR